MAPADRAAAELAAGRAVLLVDDAGGTGSSLVVAGELASPLAVAFMVRHTSGFLCAAMTEADCDRLDLPPMFDGNDDAGPSSVPFAVSVDARSGTTTGISAHDRALTFNALADPSTVSGDLARPGHVVPLRARGGGVLERAGCAEAAVDLCRLAGLRPIAALAELVTDGGAVPSAEERRRFCDEHAIEIVSIDDVADRRRCARTVTLTGRYSAVTPRGTFEVSDYLAQSGGGQCLALRFGEPVPGEDVLVGVHSECLVGDVFGGDECTCGEVLDRSLDAIVSAGRGLLVYLRAWKGLEVRHQVLDAGHDLAVVETLTAEGVGSVRLLAEGAATVTGLERHGARVTATVPLADRNSATWNWPARRAAPSSA